MPLGLPIYMHAGTADWTKYFFLIVTIYILFKGIQYSSKSLKWVKKVQSGSTKFKVLQNGSKFFNMVQSRMTRSDLES